MLTTSAITAIHGAVMMMEVASALKTANAGSHRRQRAGRPVLSPSRFLSVPHHRGPVLRVPPSHSHRLSGKISDVLILTPATGTSCPWRLAPLAFALESPKWMAQVAAEDGLLKQKLHMVGRPDMSKTPSSVGKRVIDAN